MTDQERIEALEARVAELEASMERLRAEFAALGIKV